MISFCAYSQELQNCKYQSVLQAGQILQHVNLR